MIFSCSSTLVPISGAFFIEVFPVIPSSGLMFLSIVYFLLIRVSVNFVCLSLFLFPLRSLHHVVVLHVAHLLQRYGRLVSILLPNLSDNFLSFIQCACGVCTLMFDSFWYVWDHLRVDFFRFFYLIVSHFRNRLWQLLLMFLLGFVIFFNRFLVIQYLKLFLNHF